MENSMDSFDFKLIGQEIKNQRMALGLTRAEFAEIMDKCEKHMANIENCGKFPSVQLLFSIAKYLDISLDQYIFGTDSRSKSTARRVAESALDDLTDEELVLIKQMADGLRKLRKGL